MPPTTQPSDAQILAQTQARLEQSLVQTQALVLDLNQVIAKFDGAFQAVNTRMDGLDSRVKRLETLFAAYLPGAG